MNNALVNTSVGYPVHGWAQGVCGGGPVPYNPIPWWFWVGLGIAVFSGNAQKRRRSK